MEKIIWGIDPGSSICGVCELRAGLIGNCFNVEPHLVYHRIMSLCGADKINIVIEDVYPYSNRLTPDIIATCKLIGRLQEKFENTSSVYCIDSVPRNSIKKWIFDTVPEECLPRIEKKIADKHNAIIKKWQKLVEEGKADATKKPKGFINNDGTMRTPSFNWVDDRIVIAALKKVHNIPTPKPGKQNVFGLREHNWQALAAASFIHYRNISNH